MFTVLKTVAMKNVLYFTMLTSMLNVMGVSVFAQNETIKLIPKVRAITETPITTPSGKPLIITLRNAAEKSVAIFAGPKEEIKDPKVNVVGGLSTNILYLKENDAVCLMTIDKRPVACTIIKPGVTSVEVNISANAISSK